MSGGFDGSWSTFTSRSYPWDSTTTTAVLDAARRLRLSVYNAAYLDLARFRDVPIATLDDHLTRACQASGVRLVSYPR